MRIEEQVVIGAPPARVWTVIADPLALSAIEPGVLIEPDGDGTSPGLRARYRAMLRVGPVPAGGEVEIVEYVEGRELAWTSLTGIDQRFRLRVREEDAGRTRADAALRLQLTRSARLGRRPRGLRPGARFDAEPAGGRQEGSRAPAASARVGAAPHGEPPALHCRWR